MLVSKTNVTVTEDMNYSACIDVCIQTGSLADCRQRGTQSHTYSFCSFCTSNSVDTCDILSLSGTVRSALWYEWHCKFLQSSTVMSAVLWRILQAFESLDNVSISIVVSRFTIQLHDD